MPGRPPALVHILWSAAIMCWAGHAQAGPAQPEVVFEAASVKLSPRIGAIFTKMQGGPGTADPGRITYTAITLRNVLSQAYGVGYDAVFGPGSLDDVRVDISATMPHGTTRGQLRLMLAHLLEQRFMLVAHLESRETDGYALVLAKDGPILKRANEDLVSVDSAPVEVLPGGPWEVDEDGFPVTPVGPGVREVCILGGCRFRATSASMEELADHLPCRCQIVDQTHLTGKYAFILTANVQRLARPWQQADEMDPMLRGRSFPDIFHALQTQLGLKLERKKVPTSVLLVDHIESVPIEN